VIAAVIGGGIAGCATAALLAEAGAAVTLYEREAIGAGASGRNSGILQHPMDPVLAPLYEASLALYGDLEGFELPEPAGVLVVSEDDSLAAAHQALAERFPELSPEWLAGDELHAAEPALARDLYAYRVHAGRPIGPTAATNAWAARARAAGASIVVGAAATAARGGVRVGGEAHSADAVVVAAGPWTPEAIGGGAGWVRPNWGVVAQVRLSRPPRHALEQAGVEALTEPGGAPPSLFSLVTTGEVSAVGSTFTADEPDAATVAPALLERGARYVPELAGAEIEHVRACARPLSADGRPLIGPVPEIEGLHVITGHGAWGITLGPGSAKLLVRAMTEGAGIPPELAAGGVGWPSEPRVFLLLVVVARLHRDDLAVGAGAVDVVLDAELVHEHERLAVTLVAARVDVHALARAGGDLGVGVALDRLDLLVLAQLELRRVDRVGLGVGLGVGRVRAGVLGHVEAHDEPVLAGPVDVVLLAVPVREHERLAVADVAARVDVHPGALALGDLRVGVAGDGLGLLALTERDLGLLLGRLGRRRGGQSGLELRLVGA
jgi:D-amino-acid dehydrogenase